MISPVNMSSWIQVREKRKEFWILNKKLCMFSLYSTDKRCFMVINVTFWIVEAWEVLMTLVNETISCYFCVQLIIVYRNSSPKPDRLNGILQKADGGHESQTWNKRKINEQVSTENYVIN